MKFKMRLETKELFEFSLIHSYTGSGLLLSIVAIVAGIMMIVRGTALNQGIEYAVIGVLFIAMFIIINPFMIYLKAKKQALTNPLYQVDTEYELDEKGIHICIEEQTGVIEWNQIEKIRFMRGMYFLYTGSKSAFIFSRDKLGSQADEVMQYVFDHVSVAIKLPKDAKRS